MQIPIYNPAPQYEALREELEQAAKDVLASGIYILGPNVEAFEQAVAEYLGCRHAVGVNSGTDALVIALVAAGVGHGDEVVTSPFTFFATAEAISLVGAHPRFADIDPATFNLTAETIEAAITDRTTAILPVHVFGQGPDMQAVNAVAKRHDLRVVEDVAQGFGARQGSKGLGALGDLGAHSFYPTKNLAGFGDGGMITTNSAALADHCRKLRVHGSAQRDHHPEIGYNSRLDALQAALLRVKLPHVDTWNQQRRDAAAIYTELLDGVDGVISPVEAPHGTHIYHQYTVRITNGRRDAVKTALQEAGIGCMVYYSVPVHHQPVYKHLHAKCPEAERACGEVLSLPMWPGLPADAQEQVVEALNGALR